MFWTTSRKKIEMGIKTGARANPRGEIFNLKLFREGEKNEKGTALDLGGILFAVL